MLTYDADDLPGGGQQVPVFTAMLLELAKIQAVVKPTTVPKAKLHWATKVRIKLGLSSALTMRNALKGRPICIACRVRNVKLSHLTEQGENVYEQHCFQCLDHIEAWERWACATGGIRANMVECGIPLKRSLGHEASA